LHRDFGYCSGVTFGESDRAALAAAQEIKIETQSATGTVHRTIIWVAEHDGEIYVRSVNGPDARWYREAISGRPVAIHLGGRRLPVTLEGAIDPASVEACSEGLRAKYKRSYSLRAMLAEDVLPTTLRAVPA
jgi:hypothetical protein